MRLVFALGIVSGAPLMQALVAASVDQRSSSDAHSVHASTVASPVTAPANVNSGAVSLNAKAPACTASAVAYTTSLWIKSPQVTISDDGEWWDGKDNVNWTFSTNTSNVVLGWPQYPSSFGDGDPENPDVLLRTHGNSFTLNMSSTTSSQEGMLMFDVFAANSTNTQASFWNKSTPLGAEQNVTFELSIEGAVPCDHPVGNASCANGEITATKDSWEAYAVDDWFQNWYQQHSSTFTNASGMMQQFRNQFSIGTGGICNINSRCQVLSGCRELPTANETEAGAAYLVWVAMENLSDLFFNADTALDLSELYTLTQIGDLALKFSNIDADVNPPSVPPLAIASGAMGALSGVSGAVGLGFASGALGIVSGIAGAVNTGAAKTTFTMPDAQYATNAANATAYLGKYLQDVRDAMETAYNDIFTIGTNITTLLGSGSFVNRSELQLDCASCAQQSQGWLEQYLGLKMINSIWTQQNAFIVLLPYGKITQVDSGGNTGVSTMFDESDCENFDAGQLPKVCFSQDGTGVDWPTGMGPGMAVMTFYDAHSPKNKPGDKNGAGVLDLTTPPAGTNYTGQDTSTALNTTGSAAYNFDVTDAITSAVGGFAAGGFGYDYTEDMVQAAITSSNGPGGPISELFNATASTPGMFNLPVCIMHDLNRFPTYWSQPGRQGSDSLCQCFGSKDKNGKQFQDAVVPELQFITSHALEVDQNVTCS